MVTIVDKLQYNPEDIESKIKNIYRKNDPREMFSLEEPNSVSENISVKIMDNSVSDTEFNETLVKHAWKLYSEAFVAFEVIPIEKPFSIGNVLLLFGNIQNTLTKPKHKTLLNIIMKCCVLKALLSNNDNFEDQKTIVEDIIEEYIKYISTYLD
jgi:hypothetical protein